MVTAFNMKLKVTPFYENHLIADSPPPANPFNADMETVDRIKGRSQQWY